MSDHVFPQHGDEPDAANWAQAHGKKNNVDYVEAGLKITVDWTVPSFDISAGKAIISADSMETAHPDIDPSETRESVAFVVQLDARAGIGLITNGNQHIYLDANLDTNDSPKIVVQRSQTPPSSASLHIARINTQDNVVDHLNRSPSIETTAIENTAELDRVGKISDSTALDGAHDVEIEGNIAYVAGKNGTFATVDITNPSDPVVLASITTFINAQAVRPDGKYCYLGDDNGVHTIDVQNPASPVTANTVTSPSLSSVNGFAQWGDYLLCATKSNGTIVIVDISEPRSTTLFGEFDTTANGSIESPHDVIVHHGHAIVPNQSEGASPKLAAYKIVSEKEDRLRSVGNWTLEDTYDNSNLNGANQLATDGRYIYVAANYSNTFGVIDAADLANMSQVSNVSANGTGTNVITAAGPYVAVASGDYVDMFDVRDPTDVSLAAYSHDNGLLLHDLAFNGGAIAATAQGTDELHIFRPGQIEAPAVTTGSLSTS